MEHHAVSTSQKRHAVCIPYPAQGHINPMLKLAKLLHSKGFHITFVNTDYNHRRILRSHGPHALDDHRSFRFETIPDGLPWTDVTDKQDMLKLIDSTINNCLTPFKNLLNRLNTGYDIPPVTSIVSDASMSFTIDAAEEFQIPVILLWTNSATAFNLYLHYQKLIEKRIIPRTEIDLKKHLEIEIDWIPSLKKIKLKDFPGFVTTTELKDPMIDFIVHVTGRSSRANAIVVNSFDDLESNVIESLRSMLLQETQIYTIGPVQFLEDRESEIGKLRLNLWEDQEEEEEIRCFDWLDSKAKGTVLYVNFGSLTMLTEEQLTEEQLTEFAWGLAGSGKEFLWVVRSGTVDGDSSIFLPAEFRSETENRGMVIDGWCCQEKVLSHPSIGGFLTHCGWNSTMESLFAGVPMLCWPFFADQITNRRFCCDEWGIGVEIGDEVKRENVEAVVREIMEGERGKRVRETVVKWRSMAEEATEPPCGSSYVNFETVVNKVLN